jgi:hypothetical protein
MLNLLPVCLQDVPLSPNFFKYDSTKESYMRINPMTYKVRGCSCSVGLGDM